MDEMQEIIQDFLTESAEILESLDNKFIDLEKTPDDLNLLNEIFRAVHTIKGAAGFLGFKQLVEVAHAAENVLNKLRQGEMKATTEVMDVILEGVDFIKLLHRHIKDNDQKEEDTSEVIGKLVGILQKVEAAPQPVAVLIPEAMPKLVEPQSEPQPQSQPETIIVQAEQVKPVEQQTQPDARTQTPEVRVQAEQSIRVDTKRLDDVLNLVGELVLGRNRLMKLTSKLEGGANLELESAFNEVSAHIDLITSDLQLAVMKTRMQPVGKVFGKFPRMVRDLAKVRGKDVELVLSGEETEVDKSVVEEIGDPLVHLVRNSIDHGMEPNKEDRIAKGKPEKGTVKLSAYQEGDHIVIEVSDDGRGINVDAVKAKAIEKGILTEADAAKMEEKEALSLIFLPGFSTAKEVTDISGRGVGMDVVKTNISRLNGTIEIDSRMGIGTRFMIKLPLTMAIIQTLMVEVGREMFAVPLSNVLEAIKLESSALHRIEGREVITYRDAVLPVIRLSDQFNISVAENNHWYLVVIIVNNKRYGILVDRLIGQEEVVIKPIDSDVTAAEEVAGATITGDGKVVLILDVGKMILNIMDERLGKR